MSWPIGSASKFEALLEHGQGFVDAIVSNQRHAEPLKDIGQQRRLVAGWPCGRLGDEVLKDVGRLLELPRACERVRQIQS